LGIYSYVPRLSWELSEDGALYGFDSNLFDDRTTSDSKNTNGHLTDKIASVI